LPRRAPVRCADSPIASEEAGTPPPFEAIVYAPSTWPGSRLPRIFRNEGSAVDDHLGDRFSLSVLNGADASPMEKAARAPGVPIEVVRIDQSKVRRVCERDHVRVRPDQHVAWRGNRLPTDCSGLLAHAVGRAAQ
jgi:hypothetical protein